jgi:amidase
MQVHLRRIERLNPRLTAIVAQLPGEACLALADEADRRLARGEPVGPLHGLPIAFKDLEPAVGFPQTLGSPIFRDQRPAEDSVLIERLRAAGALGIGKSNVPEFGMGSQTYNSVYGTTHNPWDLTRTAGGSSGGAAAALAAQPRQLQQHRGAAPDGRARADGTGTLPLLRIRGQGSDGPLGRRCRAAAWRAGRRRRA